MTRKSKGNGNKSETLKQKIEEKKIEAAEMSEKQITDERIKNENEICGILGSIDFKASPIPPEKKTFKSNPDQPCSDLELAKDILPIRIRTTVPFPADTSVLDKKIKEIAEKFRSAVAVGDTKAAFAAKAGLIKIVTIHRIRIPKIKKKDVAEEFIKKLSKYADRWLLLIAYASDIDQYTRAIKDMETLVTDNKKKVEDHMKIRREWVSDDNPFCGDYSQAFKKALETAYNNATSQTFIDFPKLKEVYDWYTILYFLSNRSEFNKWCYDSMKNMLMVSEDKYNTLYASTMQAVLDTDSKNDIYYDDIFEDIRKELNDQDAELAKSLKRIASVNKLMATRRQSEGSQLLGTIILETAEKTLKQDQEDQKKIQKSNEEKKKEAFRHMGLNTPEEQKEYEEKQAEEAKKKREEQEQKLRELEKQQNEQLIKEPEQPIYNDDEDDE